ncbi:NAD(+) synthase [Pelagibacterium sp. H642]|uniref:NAD(+) synthase n=1 Tax=Pelagibacterium sp. H642 TaxID=1881069 RepID=UPI0028163127|nr:NAD(+) synthase [Pelagibacterium sp. H642]WMT90812.1 NAD(+) synthase [Pelagibacterium sp. H642]
MSSLAPSFAAPFSRDALVLDAEAEAERIVLAMRRQLRTDLKRRGLVLGVSGGIDSSVCAALAARAVGPERAFAVMMPENDSDPESQKLAEMLLAHFGIAGVVENIGETLDSMGCYRRRDDAIRALVPQFGPGWGCKVVIANALESDSLAISFLVVQSPAGEIRKLRMPAEIYLAIIAATNMKQRTRKQLEYYHADRLNYAVIGTPNRLEYDQGFFVKNGDGAADIKPIAHLLKSQVYQLAEYLGVPKEICRRPPTTDTWSLAQSQEEFYFSVPYAQMDLCLLGLDLDVSREEVATATGLTPDQVTRVWTDIEGKRKATRYLHLPPLLVD